MISKRAVCKTLISLVKRRISLTKTKMADMIEIEEECIFSLYLMISCKIANLKDRISMNHQTLQMFMMCLRSIYASMRFNCTWC